MANSSMLVFPNSTAPFAESCSHTAASYTGEKCSSIREPQVVGIPCTHRLSFNAKGIPVRPRLVSSRESLAEMRSSSRAVSSAQRAMGPIWSRLEA